MVERREHGPDHRDDGDCNDGTEKAGDQCARHDTNTNNDRTECHLLTHDERLQDVTLELSDQSNTNTDEDGLHDTLCC